MADNAVKRQTYQDRLLKCLDAMASMPEPPLECGFTLIRDCCRNLRESMDKFYLGDRETARETLDELEIRLGLRFDPRLEKQENGDQS